MASDAFAYEALPTEHVRILRVDCEYFDRRQPAISTRLQAVHVGCLPYFIALSYAWPPQGSPTRPLVCNGQNMNIQEHVYTALEYLTPPTGSGSFAIWIDAICIDQANDAEKADQVPRMEAIYGQASEVVVWLGDNELADEHRTEIESLGSFAVNLRTIPSLEDYKKPPLSLISYGAQEAINSFTRSSWFTRLWIVQEVCLGHKVTVMCGHCFISWDSLLKLHHLRYSKASAEEIEQKWRLILVDNCRSHFLEQRTGSVSAKDIIRQYIFLRDQDVTLPIDRIYAPLCLVPDLLRWRLPIDYNLADEYWKVYVALARLLLPEPLGIMLFSVAYSPNKLPELPSWCPDWSDADMFHESEVELPERYSWDYHDSHDQLESQRASVLFSGNFRHIQIEGLSIGIVTKSIQTGLIKAPDVSSKAFAEVWLLWQSAALTELEDLYSGSPLARSMIHRHVRNLLMDSPCHDGNKDRPETISEDEWPTVIQCYWEATRYCEAFLETGGPARAAPPFPGDRLGRDFLRGRSSFRAGTYFFTDQGQIGRGVTREQPGDALVALHTARTPFLLRYKDSNHVAELVGEVYLEDFKDFAQLRSEGQLPTLFTIG